MTKSTHNTYDESATFGGRFFRKGTEPVFAGRRLLCCLGFLFLCLFISRPAVAAPPPAGSMFENQASGSYQDENGDFIVVQTNAVRTTVLPLEALLLTSDQYVIRPLGSTITLSHKLTNNGNILSSYTTTLENLAGDDFDLTGLALYLDENSNGLIDPGEKLLAPTDIINLNPKESAFLIVFGIIPVTALDATSVQLQIKAKTILQGLSATNRDVIGVKNSAILELRKSASVTNPSPGDELLFSVTTYNKGGGEALPVTSLKASPLYIDGIPAEAVLIRDIIPANTAYVPGTLRSFTADKPLYHRIGDPVGSYVSSEPDRVDAVACAVEKIGPEGYNHLEFRVKINPNAAGFIVNSAQAFYDNGLAFGTIESKSNTVTLPLPQTAPKIDYFKNDRFDTLTHVSHLGAPLYVQADAVRCNADPQKIEERPITIISSLTGDSETLIGIESGPNTGLFRILPNVETRDAKSYIVARGNGILEVLSNDKLVASIEGCGSGSAFSELLIDPAGIIFNSASNEPVAKAKVTLIDVTGACNGNNPGGPAKVLDIDGVTSLPAEITTGIDGQFSYPLVSACTYRLDVIAPNGFRFPSQVPLHLLPPGRNAMAAASYGAPFPVSAETGSVRIDIPLDPAPATGLLIEKTASALIAGLGDFIDYTIKIKNLSGITMKQLALTDALPFGFSYVPGSTRLNGTVHADPEGGHGPSLVYRLPNLLDGTFLLLTYRVKIGASALQGDGVNRAQAIAARGTRSNQATAQVKVVGGVFSDRGFIIGKVFTDCNRNRIQDDEEPGIPGIRLYLEDGTFVISDSEGKYSFYGVSPRTHVLKLDATSLPEGAELIDLSNRNAADAGSRFIDLQKGEIHKANFAEGSCNANVMKEVKLRRAQGEIFVAETELRVRDRFSFETDTALTADPRANPSSGVIGTETKIPTFKSAPSAADKTTDLQQLDSGSSPDSRLQVKGLEELLIGKDNSADVLNLSEGTVLPARQSNILTKGKLGSGFRLTVNGAEVSESRIGKKISDNERQLEGREYIGVEMLAGTNLLELSQLDPFGNVREKKTLNVLAPDLLHSIILDIDDRDFPADGYSEIKVKVRLVDERGVTVASRTQLTLESSLGRWQVTDLNGVEPGVQVFLEGGSAEFFLLSPQQPGEALVRVSSGVLTSESKLFFVPELRPIIATGLVEGTINLQGKSLSGMLPTYSRDGFDQELRNFSVSADNDKFQAAGRTAFFLKGKVAGDYLLTLAYDSDKDTKERLFRDIQPEEFYPVYGDSAVRGYDAQSTSKLYVRVDKNRSYLLYGDFVTPQGNESRTLGSYNRSLTGIKGHYENNKVNLNVFASEDSTRQIIEEVPGKGTSGPYGLKNGGIIVNSEQVAIITRDRNQPSLILKTEPQVRFSDYEIDAVSGQIIFKMPVATYNSAMNPQSIRVIYEVYQGGDNFWVAGADVQVKLLDRWEVGGAYIRDENPVDHATLSSVNSTVKLTDKTFLIGEWASMTKDSSGNGEAQRLELRHEGNALKVRAQLLRADLGFDNPTAGIGRGRLETNANLDYKIRNGTILHAEALHSEDLINDGKRDGLLFGLQQSFGKAATAELGMRYSKETTAPSQIGSIGVTPLELTTVRAKLSSQLPMFPKVGLFGEYEQSVNNIDRQMASVGGDYRFSEKGRLYLRHQFISSLTGPFGLNGSQQQNTSLVGIDSEYMKDGNVFSEYRIRDAVAGRDSEAAIGLRNGWNIAQGVRLNTTFERIESLTGKTDTTATAVTGAVEYLPNPLWKGSARLEFRFASSSNTTLATLGVAHKLNRNITLLGRNILSLTDNKGGVGDKIQDRLQTGFAYRPTDTDTWNVLGKYEFRYEDDQSLALASSKRKVHVVSSHLNYQPKKALTMSALYAGKYVAYDANRLSSYSNTHMLRSRIFYDLANSWDVGLNGGVLFNGFFNTALYGIGAEVGYLVAANLWISTGYNFFGYSDKDLTAEEYTNDGVYLRLRFKFDEDLFSGKDAVKNKTLAPVKPIAAN